MIERFRILGPLVGLIGLAGCAAQPVATAPAAASAVPPPAETRPLPATTAPAPVVPPARSGTGRAPAAGSGSTTPTAVVIPGDPPPRTPLQTLEPPPERRPPS